MATRPHTSLHSATVRWRRSTATHDYDTYNRAHVWDFGPGGQVAASAAPPFLGLGDAVDPEQAFVAALSSCHMLTFLAIAARKGLSVSAYVDTAEGRLAPNDAGRLAVTEVTLRPEITFDVADPAALPDAATLARLHTMAHRGCFIASSVTTAVTVVPSPALAAAPVAPTQQR